MFSKQELLRNIKSYQQTRRRFPQRNRHCYREHEIWHEKYGHQTPIYPKKHEDKIKCIVSNIEQRIDNLKAIMSFNDVNLIPAYKSRNTEFRRLPPQLKNTLSNFAPVYPIYHQVGFLSASYIQTNEHGTYTFSLY